MKILANDGIDLSGKSALEAAGHVVITDNVAQGDLAHYINDNGIDGLLVRSATTVRVDLIDQCSNLKFVGRGGVGIDNIDAAYAREKGIVVFNTPASSSASVAELVMSMMFASARFVYASGKDMSVSGHEKFASLKKSFSKGFELRGKTLAIVGFGRIGKSLASYALGCGMKVIGVDRSGESFRNVELEIGDQIITVSVPFVTMEEVFTQADFISLHVPKQPNGAAVFGKAEMMQMKKGVVLINTSRGGVVEEDALIEMLDSGQVGMACLDVFINEPTPRVDLIQHPKVIATPHIGASTAEAQERIGLEIAEHVASIVSSLS